MFGYVFLGFGMFFLINLFVIAYSTLYDNAQEQLLTNLSPWIVPTAICFIIGILGFIETKPKRNIQPFNAPPTIENLPSPPPVTIRNHHQRSDTNNNWKIPAYLFLAFGFILFFFGFFASLVMSSTFYYFNFSSFGDVILFTAWLPWLVAAFFAWAISIVCFHFDNTEHWVNSRKFCPSCGHPLVFIQDNKKWYCLHERRFV